jgi:transposase InsO family protein
MNAAARFCRPRFSPQGFWNQVEATAVQDALRLVFSRWGRPARFRVDNGTPWGSAGDLPTDLALWLIGLGVAMIWNPPRRPQDNGVVERSQGTGKRWTEPKTCSDPEELQRRINDMDRIQREVYPSLDRRSRLQVFPELQQPLQTYSKAWEKRAWDMELVLAHLADYSVPRRVDRKGQVSVYNRNHYIGQRYRGQDVYVALDPVDREWVFSTREGVQLRHKTAVEIDRDPIMKLQVSHRR